MTAKTWLREQVLNEWTPEKVQQCAMLLINRVTDADVEDLYEEELDFDEIDCVAESEKG